MSTGPNQKGKLSYFFPTKFSVTDYTDLEPGKVVQRDTFKNVFESNLNSKTTGHDDAFLPPLRNIHS